MCAAIKPTQMVTDVKVKQCPLSVSTYSLQTVEFHIQLVCKVLQICHFHGLVVTRKKVSKGWKKLNSAIALKVLHHLLRLMLTPIPLIQSDYGERVQQRGKGLQAGRQEGRPPAGHL